MSVTSGFFNSLNGDRRYTAEQFSELINTLVNDGVFQNIGTAFSVTANTGNEITVGIGRCWFNGVWLMNDALYPITLRDSELLLNRIDAVVIEINHSESVRSGSIKMVSGTPASDPQRPVLTKTDEIHQYPLAYIYRKAGVNEVSQADITNMIGTSECPYITGILETQDIDKIVAQWEAQFNTWFEGVQDILDSDTAAKLASAIIELDSKFATLAKERAVYEELEDSSGGTVMDSMSSPIQARTVMAAAGATETRAITPVMTDNSAKVGDTISTLRTDLDDRWLLCNGDIALRSAYPALANIIGLTPSKPWTTKAHNANGYETNKFHRINGMKYLNGRYFIYGILNGYTAGIAYSTSVTGPWTVKELLTGNYNQEPTVTDIDYINGTYIASVYKNRAGYLYYSTNLSTWSASNAIAQSYVQKLLGVVRVGSYYVVAYCNGNSDYSINISYATSLSGSWTAKTVFQKVHNEYMRSKVCIASNGSYAAVFGCGYDANNANQYNAAVCYFTTPASLTYKELPFSSTLGGQFIANDAIYNDSYFIVGGSCWDTNSGYQMPVIAICAGNPNGEWDITDCSDTFPNAMIRQFIFDGSNYIALVYYNLQRNNYNKYYFGYLTSTVPTLAWRAGYIDGPQPIDDNTRFIEGETGAIRMNDLTNVYTYDSSYFVTPEISVGALYTYIKAKE